MNPSAHAPTGRRGVQCLARLLVLTLLTLSQAMPCAADDRPPAGAFSERVDVDLVQIEVTVRDADGRPVAGLGRDEFQVRFGGKKVDLSLFSEVRLDAGSDAETGEPGAPEGPVFVALLVDRDHLDGGLPEDAVAVVGDFVRAGAGGAMRTIVLATRGDRLEVAQPLTADAEAVMAALRGLDLRPSPATASVEYRRLLAELRRAKERPEEDNGALSRDELPQGLRVEIDGLSHKVYRELAQLTLQIDRAISGMAGLPGRKELVLVTGSLPNQVAKKLNDAWNDAFGNQSAHASRPSLAASSGGVERLQNRAAESGVEVARTGELFDLLADRANAQGVTLHVLGAVGPSDGSLRVDEPAQLATLAKRTGGRAVVGNHASRVLESVAEGLRSYYVLAFSPPERAKAKDAANESAEGPVAVEVELRKGRKGLEVSYREAVRPVNLEERAALAAVSALLVGSVADASSGLALTSRPPVAVEGRDDVLRLPVTVLIPLRHLTLVADADGPHRGRASLFFTTGDLASGAREVQKVVLPLQLTPDQLEGIEERDIEYGIDVPMAKDASRLAVALRDDLSGAILATATEIQRLKLTP